MHIQSRKLIAASSLALAMVGFSIPAAADSASQSITDARQETQIWTTYALSPYLRAHDLKVSVRNGKATLTGKVEEDVNKDLAKQIALGVKGITDVDNQIVVQADYTPPARSDGERGYGDVIDDATITSAVKSKLLWSRHTDGLTTDVDTSRGKVTLSGTADSKAAKDLATRLAQNTRGVVSVDNQLVVSKDAKLNKGKDKKLNDADTANGSSTKNEAKRDVADGWITTKVKSTFMYSSNVDGSDISVETQGGIVTLTGKVDSGAERALAIELAQNVRGVKNVRAKGLTVSNVVANR